MGSVVAGVAAYAVARGVPLERIVDEIGCDPSELVNPDEQVPAERMPALWRLLAAEFPGEVVSLELARVVPISHLFGPLGNAIRFASDLRSSIMTFVRYRELLSDQIFLELVEDPPEARVHLRHPLDTADDGYAAEMGVAISKRLFEEFLGVTGALSRVEFVHGPHGPLAVYEDYFGVPVHFHRPAYAAVLHHDWLERPIRQSKPELLAYVFQHLDKVRDGLRAASQDQELDRVRAAIVEDAKRQVYSAKSLARRLGMSERSLLRFTRVHGSSVQALLDEVRRANAERLLADPKFSIEEVALLLGYSSDRSFRRAFERWTGQSPAQFRRAPP